ncbi:lipid II:glycine glycyltransferase FemX [Bacillus infantis]|uniref:Lipid II:glycine glycyltransferase n=1 Tax=Bacillus infantis TaxID=324767 RepID=A0A5D4R8U2_9BACI|nr:GNAT family N-acetyltransferase [Bacillus infantis]TYS47050.1 GNAT family N-acetyltransferase [Bacillus infantis]
MLSSISIDDMEKWNKIVKGFKNYDVYYLSDYVRAFNLHGDGEPKLFYYEDDDIKAMNVVMKRDISLDKRFSGKIPPNTYYDTATPYGYGGFLIEGKLSKDNLLNLENEYCSICKIEGIISEFVRFHPVINNAEVLNGLYDITTLGKTITVDLLSKEHIWSNLASKNRNMIRKANNSGVEIFWGRDTNLIEEFIGLYNATMDKDHAHEYYYFNKDFYNSVLKDLKYNSLMFYAVFEKKIIAMSFILYSNEKIHYHLSASDRNYQKLAPTNLLLYEVACWGCENGYKTFHLGGGLGSKEDSLYKFKKVFNKNSNTSFSIGKKIFNKEVYNELVRIREIESYNTTFFPLYRS